MIALEAKVHVIPAHDGQPRITLAQDGSITFHRPEGNVVLDADALQRLLEASG